MLWQAFGRWGAFGRSGINAPGPLALVNRAASAAIANNATITFDTEVYDPSNVITVTSGQMTIPSTGLYRVTGGFSCTIDNAGQRLHRNGGTFTGGLASFAENATPRWVSAASAIVSLTASDVIEYIAINASTYGAVAANYTSFCIERIDPATRYALIRKSSHQASFTSGTLTFDTETADVGGWHDNAVNNERLTVLPGVSRVRLSACVIASGTATFGEAEIRKNGTGDIVGLPYRRRNLPTTASAPVTLSSPPINVSSGDYFTLWAGLGASGQIDNDNLTWLCVEEVSSNVKSCLAYKSSGQTVSSGADTTITFDSEDHDPFGMHSTSVDTSRFTVPSGCSYAKVHFQLKGASASTVRIHAQVTKNGGAAVGTALDAQSGGSGASDFQRLGGVSAWMPVTPGDYFELLAFGNAGSVAGVTGWFALECI